MKKKRILNLFRVVTVILFLVILYQVYKLAGVTNQIENLAMENVRNEGKRVGIQLDSEFTKIMAAAHTFADDLVTGNIPKESLREHLKRVLNENSEIFGFGIAYQPYAYDTGTRLYAPYLVRTADTIEDRSVETYYDYTTREDHCRWYYKTIERRTADWMEPYLGKASETMLAEYTIPLYSPRDKNKETPIGVLFINYSLEGLTKIMHSLELGKSGYGFILSREGTFLAHPRQDYVNQRKKFLPTLQKLKKPEREKIIGAIEKLKKGGSGIIEIDSHMTGEVLLMFLHDIPSTGWPLIAVFMAHDIPIDRASLNHGILWIIVAAIIFLSMFFALVFRVYNGDTRAYWKLSTLFSLTLCLGIGLIWNLDFDAAGFKDVMGAKVFDHTEMTDYLRENTTGDPVYIPTGVFIQSLEFTSSNNVFLTGYIWQRYAGDLPPDISRGFVLPEAIDADIEEAYTRKNEHGVTIGWYFEATLRQPFDYSKYPLGQMDVWIRLWHKNFDKNVILVPDLDSYNLINPSSLPGLEQDIVLSGLTIRKSFFSYVPKSYNANFGIDKYQGRENFPELYFTVIVTRGFIDPFISYLLPAIVVAGIIFSLFLIITGDKERTEKFAYNCSFILGASAGLFFSVLIAHSQLRNSLQLSEIVYLEYFYLVLYVMILVLAVNSFLFSLGTRFKWIHFRDNLIPKLLFWPFVLVILFVITVATFY